MKLLGWIFFFVVALLIIISQIKWKAPKKDFGNSTETTSTYDEDGNDQALAAIRTEPKIKEALITEANVLYVSVIDDGTRRDGYASYLCEILREHKAKASRVKVVKVNSTNDPDRNNDFGILLGESWCD